MRVKFVKQTMTFLIVLSVLAAFVYAGWYVQESPTWGVESGTVSDSLLSNTGKDTTSTWNLQYKTGNGRGREMAREVGIKWKVQETATSDSGLAYLYVDVSNDGTDWFPWNGSATGIADTADLQGTAGDTKYFSTRLTNIVPAKYMRGRVVAASTSTDSIWVSDFQVTKIYYD